MIEVDYLVVGAGAMGMAFADVVLTETDATVAIVDRYGSPGGHWTRSYPHVRLHQPSAFYGVNSRPLGSDIKDTTGGNAGLFELASGSEVVAYFDQVMNHQFLPTGRVHYFPMCEYAEGGSIVSLVSEETHEVAAKKIVDATYSQVTVPSMRPPAYDVAGEVRCLPPNALTTINDTPSGYVVIGAGKTGMDACLWLLAAGVAPDGITWIVPRDPWILDRAKIQPGPDFFDSTVGGFAQQLEASALATSIDDLFERLDATGQLLRLDKNVKPTTYRCATVTVAELEELRKIENIVRMGRVRSIGTDEIVLENGSIPTSPDALHIDCTADGLARRPAVPVFDGDRITLQNLRTCQPTFSAGLTGHVEASYTDEAEKNELCTPVPYPNSDVDWLRVTLANALNGARWGTDSELSAWLGGSRLDVNSSFAGIGEPSPAQLQILGKLGEYTAGAITNLQRLLADVDDE
ncbi:MAG: NAD(P)/FAD-dependent oxidoreductase [Chloroflexi bacterium]|nr:NAD(P)/FAD-dependent oxidoreductase [Chloroflexota bacterium]